MIMRLVSGENELCLGERMTGGELLKNFDEVGELREAKPRVD